MSRIYDDDMSDYSSNSSGREPSPPPPELAPLPPAAAPKKKKKKPVPPQEAINKIWSRFSAPKFSQATVILPFVPRPTRSSFDPAKPLPVLKPKQDNLLVSEDYERAVQECRTRVQKLKKECQRVNMRYRDAEFDIDWDLKYEKGHCLNNLSKRRFDVTNRSMRNPTSSTPKAVKRCHEIFEKPTFMREKPSAADIKQGDLGDCWLMASLTALANVESGIQRICVEYDTKIGIYGFVFHRDGEWIISIIDDKLYLKSSDWDSPSVLRHLLEQIDREDVETEYRKTYQTGSKSLAFSQNKDQNETWLPLLEKAYAKAHGDFGSLWGGWSGEGIEDLTGGVTTELLTSDILDTDEFWKNEIMNVNREFLFGCYTGIVDGGYGDREGIQERHAYVIMDARELSTGQRLVKLRNPWGNARSGNWHGAWSDGSKEFTPEIQQELNHKFGTDSVFWISYADLLRKYLHLDRTRLFMDCPDWRITQKWISVDVPWKAQYSQKFKITLKKESPIVIVLSQLDDRYFEGLHGQYQFYVQFRVHEVGSPDENDFIVRSHGNYVMHRSVVTELKSLPAGAYTIFVMVTAERNRYKLSVEQLVKEQCRRRSDNEKLVQVGMSYDLAHCKTASYTEERMRVRKVQDKINAHEARNEIRRKNWERRRTLSKIQRKRDKKNKDKREVKEAKVAAEAQAKLDLSPKDQAVQTDLEIPIVNEDKGNQTEDVQSSVESDKTITQALMDTLASDLDKGVQTDSTVGSQCTPVTPKSSSRHTSPRPDLNRVPTMPHYTRSAMPPPYMRRRESFADQQAARDRDQRSRQRQYVELSEGESSASPHSDEDDLCSDDDPTLRPRQFQYTGHAVTDGKAKKAEESDDDGLPEPWNAVCIVGLRVYSQDEGLELVISEEGEECEVKQDGGGDDEGTDGDVEDSGEDGTAPKTKDAKSDDGTIGDQIKELVPMIDELKVEEAKIEEPKIEEAKIEEAKIEEPKIEEPKIEEPKIAEIQTEETNTDQVLADKLKELMPKIEELEAEEAKIDQVVADKTKLEDTRNEAMTVIDQILQPIQEDGAEGKVTVKVNEQKPAPEIKTLDTSNVLSQEAKDGTPKETAISTSD